LFGCTENKKESGKETKPDLSTADSIYNLSATITGMILNREVYPNVREVKLTIPGFEGDGTEITTAIDDSGRFSITFYPKTKREVQLYPVEDILVVQPGDSLSVTKDFKDIGNTSFYGNRAELNQLISKFRSKYLGRYPTDYQLPYSDFKNYCENEKDRNYQKLIDFQENNSCTDEFNNWAIKQIELDYCEAMFHYPRQHFARSGIELTDSSEYFSFIDNLEDKFDNSIVMSSYFKTTEQYMNYQIMKHLEYHQKIANRDTIVNLMIEDLFSGTENNYLAQFSLRTYLNACLHVNKTDWIDNNREQISTKLNDSFLRNNLQEHYDRINEFNKNPRRFSDAILGSDESNIGISFQPINGENVVKELIKANPGKVIYVDFWALWCSPCLTSLQSSKQLIADFKNKDVAFVFICINSRGDLWVEKLKELKIDGQHLFCNFEETKAIRERFNFNGVPYYLLINKKGVIVDFGLHLDPRSEYTKTQIEKLVNE
jgi:thiol-disulfide isomerase/thioredoxin